MIPGGAGVRALNTQAMRDAISPRRRRAATPLFVQIFGMILLSLAAAQAVNLAIIYFLPAPPPEVFRLTEVAQALQAGGAPTPTRSGRSLVATLQDRPGATGRERYASAGIGPALARNLADQLSTPEDRVRLRLFEASRPPARRSLRSFRDQLTSDPMGRRGDHFVVSPFEADLQRPDGLWLTIRVEEHGLLSTWQQRILLWFAASAIALAPVAFLFARRLAQPFAAFAAAAERLGRNPNAAPLAMHGSSEIVTAASAFNDMQERLRTYVQDRTTMIGAIAHDMRTPLTRLRFRVEAAPEALQAKMSADIDEMEAMIAATMAFVHDASRPTHRRRLELGSLVEAVADEMAETGLDISAEARGPVVVDGDPLALRRLTANLMENAVKFGARARARVYIDGQAAVLEVDDDGPGVPENQHEQMFEPFQRGEPSRSRSTGGAGLGLAVVRSIARAHGGEAELENRTGGGLRACARLPLAASPV